MILAMKLTSLSFELDQGGVPSIPNPLEFGGYSLSVCSVIFGPFMTYQDYCQILNRKKLVKPWRNVRGILTQHRATLLHDVARRWTEA